MILNEFPIILISAAITSIISRLIKLIFTIYSIDEEELSVILLKKDLKKIKTS